MVGSTHIDVLSEAMEIDDLPFLVPNRPISKKKTGETERAGHSFSRLLPFVFARIGP